MVLADNMLHWLNMDESFQKQRIDYTQTIVLRKKYFVTDFVVSTKNPSMLHLIFREAHYALINDFYPVTFDQAVQFAALQLQITYGNYDPLLHVANFLE